MKIFLNVSFLFNVINNFCFRFCGQTNTSSLLCYKLLEIKIQQGRVRTLLQNVGSSITLFVILTNLFIFLRLFFCTLKWSKEKKNMQKSNSDHVCIISSMLQKQPPRCVLRKRCSENTNLQENTHVDMRFR